MNYWESGLDMNWGDDLYDSFVAYQTELIQQFNGMSEEFGFHCVDARQDPRAIQRQLRRAVTGYLDSCNYLPRGRFRRRCDVSGSKTHADAVGVPGNYFDLFRLRGFS